MLQLRYNSYMSTNAATIECPNKKCKDIIWLTNAKFFYKQCLSCNQSLYTAYRLDEQLCYDRVKYYNAENLA